LKEYFRTSTKDLLHFLVVLIFPTYIYPIHGVLNLQLITSDTYNQKLVVSINPRKYFCWRIKSM